MILRLVDRRVGQGPAGADGSGDGTTLVPEPGLVGELGRPDWAVDVVLVEDDTMADLNAGFRQVPQVTDVLSFSYLLASGTGPPDLPCGRGHGCADLWLDTLAVALENGEPRGVGEVVLAPGFVLTRCHRQKWSPEHEMSLLVVHGVLHILGWDHADEAQTEAMQAVEEKILAAGGLPHPLRERS